MGERQFSTPEAPGVAPVRRRILVWTALGEVLLTAVLVVLDVLLPTILLLAMAAVSLRVRRQGLASLGLVRPRSWSRLSATTLLLTALWACVQLGLLMPVVNRVTGEQQDLSEFESAHGHLGTLAVLLVLSWTLAAVGEELAYRGYVATRVAEVAASVWGGSGAVVAAMLVSAGLFGLAHTEQGMVGVILTFFDGLFLATLRWRYGTLWAAVLAHGWNNTIGLTAFYLVGPIHGWW